MVTGEGSRRTRRKTLPVTLSPQCVPHGQPRVLAVISAQCLMCRNLTRRLGHVPWSVLPCYWKTYVNVCCSVCCLMMLTYSVDVLLFFTFKLVEKISPCFKVSFPYRKLHLGQVVSVFALSLQGLRN